jgi:hypothetical protein
LTTQRLGTRRLGKLGNDGRPAFNIQD